MNRLVLTRPDDWHLHLRDEPYLKMTVADAARQFARALVMPNLRPPLYRLQPIRDYRARIRRAAGETGFSPLMSFYLTDQAQPEEIRQGYEEGLLTAAKLYPQGATTNSSQGVSRVENLTSVLEEMQRVGMPLLVHGEVVDETVDIFDREAVFLERVLTPLRQRFPALKLVLEHVTTREGVAWVCEAPGPTAGTITAHHLHLNRNHLLAGGIRPHHYCLPVAKREEHRQALVQAATSGNKRFFLGTDSAPHAQSLKEAACGCAGVYTAHAALELYAEAFAAVGKLDRLEGFASFYGPDFYGLPRNQGHVTLVEEAWDVPEFYVYGCETLVPFRANQQLRWKLE